MPFLIWLSEADAGLITRDADNFYDRETGGTLMGYWANRHQAVVTKLISAGPQAHHETHSFEPDQSWQQNEITEHYQRSGRVDTYLGDWHTHPDTTSDGLSWTDRACVRRIITTPEARNPIPIMMLMCGRPGSWSMHPWICRLRTRFILFEGLEVEKARIRLYG